jgi:DNA-binding CsgD family transcriptional regulator
MPPTPPDPLSPRERDCLRLLQSGLLTPQVAANLGISLSTLNKHLASARQKLGVRRTAQALLVCPRGDVRDRPDVVDGAADRSPILCDFANALDACRTFGEAWAALLTHTRQFGMSFMNFGVIAEPAGRLTNGAKLLKTTMPDGLMQLYEAVGGISTDPNVRYVTMHRQEAMIDGESVITAQLPYAPKPLRALFETLHDTHLHQTLILPGRDEATGAPFAIVFAFDRKAAADFRRRAREDSEILKATRQMFWHFIQRKRLLTKFVDLSTRQREALTLAARGFTSAEAAEQMGISLRGAEKVLATARDKLGARTTPAAIYRAMVYRALV